MTPGVRALLVDNNNALRRMIRAAIESLGIEGVGEGCAVVQAARRLAPDVVLLDYHMPLMDGLEATGLISRDPCGPAIIMLASRVTPALAASADVCGISALLEKHRGNRAHEQLAQPSPRHPVPLHRRHGGGDDTLLLDRPSAARLGGHTWAPLAVHSTLVPVATLVIRELVCLSHDWRAR